MRKLCLLLLAFCTLSAFAQRAPDIARGTTDAEVVRLYGWPKGKSVKDGRESWLYDKFQVTLEDGKVLSVAYVSTGTASAARAAATPKSDSGSSAAGSGQPLSPGSTQSGNGGPSSAASSTILQVPVIAAPETITPTSPPASSSQKMVSAASPASSASTTTTRPADSLPQNDDLIRPFGVNVWWVVAGGLSVLIVIKIILTIAGARDRSFRDEMLHRLLVEKQTSHRPWEHRRSDQSETTFTEPPLISRTAAPAMPGEPAADPNQAVYVAAAKTGDLSVELLRKMERKRFELVVQLYYQATGVRTQASEAGADGDIDVKLFRKGAERPYCYVQCKAWTDNVKVRMVRELFGAMMADKIDHGVFVTTSDFWPEAREFAKANGIAAITGVEFVAMFGALTVKDRKRILGEVKDGTFCDAIVSAG